MKKYKNSIKTVILSVFAIVLLIVVVAVLSLTLVGDTAFQKPFKVTCNGETYSGNENVLILPHTGKVRFDISADKYSVKVQTFTDGDFDYEIDGKSYKFNGDDCTGLFINEKTDSYFIIDCVVGRYSLDKFLLNLQGGNTITLPELKDDLYFVLNIASGENVVEIALAQIPVTLTGESIIL